MKKPTTATPTASAPAPKSKREIPLQQRFPDAYCHRTKVWLPERPAKPDAIIFDGGGGKACIEVSGAMPDKVAQLVLWLIFEGKRATQFELDDIIAAAKLAADRIRADRKAREVPR